ncbi:hypothetical protein SLE2022_212360 [Rubroshorea leprosula]
MGDKLGKVLKIDHSSQYVCRGRFAKFYVEVDLTQKLKSRLGVGGRANFISYEGLDRILFSCGEYGHRREDCAQLARQKAQEGVTNGPSTGMQLSSGQEQASLSQSRHQSATAAATVKSSTKPTEKFGPWMLVQRRNKLQPNLNNVLGISPTPTQRVQQAH